MSRFSALGKIASHTPDSFFLLRSSEEMWGCDNYQTEKHQNFLTTLNGIAPK
jgi:hypothetical protein